MIPPDDYFWFLKDINAQRQDLLCSSDLETKEIWRYLFGFYYHDQRHLFNYYAIIRKIPYL